MNRKIFNVIVVTLIALTAVLFAAENDGGNGGAFLRMGVGARAIGMGNTFTSIADDASALYWNPAGLGLLDKKQAEIMYGALGYGQHWGFLACAIPFKEDRGSKASITSGGFVQLGYDYGTFAVGINNLNIGDIQGMDSDGDPTGVFSDNEMAMMISYGKSLFHERIAIGTTVKYIRHATSDNSANGFGFDFGLLVIPINKLQIGIVTQDLMGNLKWNTVSGHKDNFPISLRGGVSYTLPITYGIIDRGITVATEIEHNLDEDSYHPHAGIETFFLSFLGARIGYDDGDYTAGITVTNPKAEGYSKRKKQTNYTLNYAFSTSEIANKHLFSISIGF